MNNSPGIIIVASNNANNVFFPLNSNLANANADNTVTEPWMYPEYTHYIRDAIKFRYRLFPYLYSLMAASHENGDMIMNPLMAAFPEDERTYDSSDSYVLGNSLLVANVLILFVFLLVIDPYFHIPNHLHFLKNNNKKYDKKYLL